MRATRERAEGWAGTAGRGDTTEAAESSICKGRGENKRNFREEF